MAMEAVLQLFNDFDALKEHKSIPTQSLVKACLDFLGKFGADAFFDETKDQVRIHRKFCIASIIEKMNHNSVHEQIHKEYKELSFSIRMALDRHQISVLRFISHLLRDSINKPPVPLFGIIDINEQRKITGIVGDKNDEVFMLSSENEGVAWADQESFYADIKKVIEPEDIPRLQEFIAQENVKFMNASRYGASVGGAQGKPAKIGEQLTRYGHLSSINRDFEVRPYTKLAERVLSSDPIEKDLFFVPGIHFSDWLAFNQIIRSIMVNYCVYFGGTERVKQCLQCKSFVLEKRQNMKKFCSASCRFAYSREEENPNRRKCRNRQNKYIDNLSSLPEGKIGYHIYKDECVECTHFVKSGQCQKLIERNNELINQP
ncbi:MAG: hypothetical protein KQJ78_15845 [Deltaproteobacteria bacterium]|nr:hypothetical protein [Deltaproteobacteria bacterium]